MSVAVAVAATGSLLLFFYHYYKEEAQEDMEKKTKDMKPTEEQDEIPLKQQEETATSLSCQQHKPTEIIVYHPLNYRKFSSGDMRKTLVVACRDVACNHMKDIQRQKIEK